MGSVTKKNRRNDVEVTTSRAFAFYIMSETYFPQIIFENVIDLFIKYVYNSPYILCYNYLPTESAET